MKFTYNGDQPRVYVLSEGNLEAFPGQSYDLPSAPDERFVPVVKQIPTTKDEE